MGHSESYLQVYQFVKKVGRLDLHKKSNQNNEVIIPLDEATKSKFELEHKTSLDDTLIHMSPDIDEYLYRMRLFAYARNKNIYLRRNNYNRGSEETETILEHELTHVQQYSENRTNELTDELELEATLNEEKYLRNGEEIQWIEFDGQYFQMTKTEYKRMIYKVGQDFEDEIEQKLSGMDEEKRLLYLCNLQQWVENDCGSRFDYYRR
jgi:hypothetical protein